MNTLLHSSLGTSDVSTATKSTDIMPWQSLELLRFQEDLQHSDRLQKGFVMWIQSHASPLKSNRLKDFFLRSNYWNTNEEFPFQVVSLRMEHWPVAKLATLLFHSFKFPDAHNEMVSSSFTMMREMKQLYELYFHSQSSLATIAAETENTFHSPRLLGSFVAFSSPTPELPNTCRKTRLNWVYGLGNMTLDCYYHEMHTSSLFVNEVQAAVLCLLATQSFSIAELSFKLNISFDVVQLVITSLLTADSSCDIIEVITSARTETICNDDDTQVEKEFKTLPSSVIKLNEAFFSGRKKFDNHNAGSKDYHVSFWSILTDSNTTVNPVEEVISLECYWKHELMEAAVVKVLKAHNCDKKEGKYLNISELKEKVLLRWKTEHPTLQVTEEELYSVCYQLVEKEIIVTRNEQKSVGYAYYLSVPLSECDILSREEKKTISVNNGFGEISSKREFVSQILKVTNNRQVLAQNIQASESSSLKSTVSVGFMAALEQLQSVTCDYLANMIDSLNDLISHNAEHNMKSHISALFSNLFHVKLLMKEKNEDLLSNMLRSFVNYLPTELLKLLLQVFVAHVDLGDAASLLSASFESNTNSLLYSSFAARKTPIKYENSNIIEALQDSVVEQVKYFLHTTFGNEVEMQLPTHDTMTTTIEETIFEEVKESDKSINEELFQGVSRGISKDSHHKDNLNIFFDLDKNDVIKMEQEMKVSVKESKTSFVEFLSFLVAPTLTSYRFETESTLETMIVTIYQTLCKAILSIFKSQFLETNNVSIDDSLQAVKIQLITMTLLDTVCVKYDQQYETKPIITPDHCSTDSFSRTYRVWWLPTSRLQSCDQLFTAAFNVLQETVHIPSDTIDSIQHYSNEDSKLGVEDKDILKVVSIRNIEEMDESPFKALLLSCCDILQLHWTDVCQLLSSYHWDIPFALEEYVEKQSKNRMLSTDLVAENVHFTNVKSQLPFDARLAFPYMNELWCSSCERMIACDDMYTLNDCNECHDACKRCWKEYVVTNLQTNKCAPPISPCIRIKISKRQTDIPPYMVAFLLRDSMKEDCSIQNKMLREKYFQTRYQ